MDRILALYSSHALARQMKTQLVADGFASDRVDVISLADLGRAGDMPATQVPGKLDEYFRTLLTDLEDEANVAHFATAVQDGNAALVVHPRGEVEIARANRVLHGHDPLHLLARIDPAESHGRLLGEHAAGTR